LSLNYRFFKAVIGCPPDSSSSKTARQHTQRATRVARSAQNWLQASCPDFITKDQWSPNSPNTNPVNYHVWGAILEAFRKLKSKPKTRRTQGSAPGYLGQPATGTDGQGCKRFLK